MAENKFFVIANWKMNPQKINEAKSLFEAVALASKKLKNVEVGICPPFCFLPFFKGEKNIGLGAQDLFWELQGAYTGEISGKMLADLGCRYVILGHSERRQNAGESDEIINAKLKAALKCGLSPILCVGEKQGEELAEVLNRQLAGCLKDLSKNQMKEIKIAYEPVWAISAGLGTGKPCQPDDAFSASLFIKKTISNMFGRFLAENTDIIYGGSVDSKNVAEYLKDNQMKGVLVGGASLDSEEFINLLEKVNNLVGA